MTSLPGYDRSIWGWIVEQGGHLVLDGFLDIGLGSKDWSQLNCCLFPFKNSLPQEKLSFLSKGLKFLANLHHYNSPGTRVCGRTKACDSPITCHLPSPSKTLRSPLQINPLVRTSPLSSFFPPRKYFLTHGWPGDVQQVQLMSITKVPSQLLLDQFYFCLSKPTTAQSKRWNEESSLILRPS